MKRRDFILTSTAVGAGFATAKFGYAAPRQEEQAEDFTAEQALKD